MKHKQFDMKKYWVMRHPILTLLITVAVLAVMGFGLLWWASQALLAEPLCDNWRPGMTREEKILLSVEVVNEINKPRFKIVNPKTGKISYKRIKQIPYDEPEQILAEQPECCKLYSSLTAHTDSPSEEIPEGDEGIVYVNYMGRFEDSNGVAHPAPISLYANIDNCKQ